MKEEKIKVNLRIGLLIRETLVDEAAVEDIRVGTLANRLLQSELDKVMAVGVDNCLIMNSREYLASKAEIEQNRAAYYLFPETKVVSRFIATQLDDKIYPQISFYFLKEQMDVLEEKNIAFDYCPGVSSFCGAASALNLEYTLPDVSQSVIITRMEGRTPVPEKESIQSFAAHQATMVVFLSTGMLEELSRRLIEGGYTADTPAAIVYKATWEDQKTFVCTVGTLAQTAKENNITKTALMIIGDVVAHSHYDRSELYNPAFTTEFREATK